MTQPVRSQKAATSIRVPAEWEPHEACWMAYPRLPDEWPGTLEPARAEVIALCRAIGDTERVELLVENEATQTALESELAGARVRFHRVPYGDIWTRDTGPIFAETRGALGAVCFRFNGWGQKYEMPGDTEVAIRIAELAGADTDRVPWILEGGAIELDGAGTALTTRQCLLHPKRNPGVDEADVERVLADWLGVEKTIWLDRGLENDHTDGHIDTLARFVAPGQVACAAPGAGDPNREVLAEIRGALLGASDASGRPLRVVEVPSPGAIEADDGQLLPASYMNFYIANRRVIVPTYGSRRDADAVAAIGALFPHRQTEGLSARAILTGGGAFHCITKQQPRL